MIDRLLARPGVQEVVELRSSFGFMAFHGGALEEMTDVIAAEAAERAGASYYGVLQPKGMREHIPSHHFRAHHSLRLDAFLSHVEAVVAVHGYGRHGKWTTLLLGGRERRLAAHLRSHLTEALPDYEVIDDLEAIPVELRGLHPHNPVNQVPCGVQLELPPRVRGKSPMWKDWNGPGFVPHMSALIDALAAAATAWSVRA